MTTKLEVYNEALLICGERSLSSLTEVRESRYLLDHVYDNDGVQNCLESAQWKFAMRTIRLDYETTIEPEFGYRRAFTKPTDWCLTSAICEDEYFNSPLLYYVDEAGYWYCDLDEIYIRYVSNDSTYGMDLASWPSKFADFVAAHFASKIILKLTTDKERVDQVRKYREKMILEAKNHDAMADPTKFPPPGSWVNARSGRSFRNRGNRHRLIG